MGRLSPDIGEFLEVVGESLAPAKRAASQRTWRGKEKGRHSVSHFTLAAGKKRKDIGEEEEEEEERG